MKKIITCMFAASFAVVSLFLNAQTVKLIEHDSQQRAYMEFIPSSYTGSEAVPLLLAFHGLGDTITNFQAVGFQLLGEIDNFITVYPQGMNAGLGTAWNAGILVYGAIVLNGTVDDMGFVNLLLDSLVSQYNIDQTRIYATGFSNGAFMANRLACQMSHRIAAVAAAAGTRGNLITTCEPWRAIPYLHLHGNADPTVPFTGNTFGMDAPDIVEWWVLFNQCNATPVVTSLPDNVPGDGITVSHFEFTDGRDGSAVEFYIADGGGHQWLYQPVNDTTYTILIWDFLKKFSMVNLSIEESAGQRITVYPVPADEVINIIISNSISNLFFEMYNINGQTVIKRHLLPSDNIINVEHLPEGMYFWKATCDKHKTHSGKILIIHQ